MLGLGVDVAEIDRIQRALEKWRDRFAARVLTREELAQCRTKGNFPQSLAARFAAKEAFFKALPGSRHARLGWHDFAVLNAEDGRPYVLLSQRAQQLLGRHRVHVSLSHTRRTAVAVVLIE